MTSVNTTVNAARRAGGGGVKSGGASKLILPGDVLIKAEKCAEEMGALLKLPLNTAHHTSRWNPSLKVSS